MLRQLQQAVSISLVIFFPRLMSSDTVRRLSPLEGFLYLILALITRVQAAVLCQCNLGSHSYSNFTRWFIKTGVLPLGLSIVSHQAEGGNWSDVGRPISQTPEAPTSQGFISGPRDSASKSGETGLPA